MSAPSRPDWLAPPPKPRHTAVLIGGGAALLAAVATVVVAVLLTAGEADTGPPTATPALSSVPATVTTAHEQPAPQQVRPGGPAAVSAVAEAVADAYNSRNASALRAAACVPPDIDDSLFDGIPTEVTFAVTGDPSIAGHQARVLLVVADGRGGQSDQVSLGLRWDGERWCFDGVR